ncbi:MAG: RAMP superfamily CRISPR-associated protein [Candidatus Asgardarchaeia archaeon]
MSSTMIYNKPIEVIIEIKGFFRIGGETDFRSAFLPLARNKSSKIPISLVNMTSSFKGILRKSAMRFINSKILSQNNELKNMLTNSLFKLFGKSGKMQGTIIFEFVGFEDTVLRIDIRPGIKINPVFGSIEEKHIFFYEYVYNSYNCLKNIKLKFRMTPLYPLNEYDCILLFTAINGLRYDNIGGFNSRGGGFIENILVDENFTNRAKKIVNKLKVLKNV